MPRAVLVTVVGQYFKDANWFFYQFKINSLFSIRWIYWNQIPYARHYNPLLIRNRSWILTIHKTRILRKKPLEKSFLDFKKWVKSIQTAVYTAERFVIPWNFSDLKNLRFIIESGFKSRAGYDGACTVNIFSKRNYTVRAPL